MLLIRFRGCPFYNLMKTKVCRRLAFTNNQAGFTLFELLIAMLLLAMISVMIYSMLHVGIKFSEKGEKKILAMEHKYGLINLLQSQISSAVYDVKKRELLIWADDDSFKLVTRNPYIYEDAGVVLAIYRYDSSARAIYYTEKRDYYNVDYDDEYLPDISDMNLLASDEDSFAVVYDQDIGPTVTFSYRGKDYALVPQCADAAALKKLLPEE